MRAAQIDKNGLVVNVILLPDGYKGEEWGGIAIVKDAATAAPGDTWDGRVFVKPPTPEPLPKTREEELAEKEILTPTEEQEAIKLLLRKATRG